MDPDESIFRIIPGGWEAPLWCMAIVDIEYNDRAAFLG